MELAEARRAHEEVVARFSGLTERAVAGDLDHWAETPTRRLALILVLDQFTRSVWSGLNRPGFTGGQNSRRIARYGTDTKEEDREAVFP